MKRPMILYKCFLAAVFFLTIASGFADEPWKELFDGKTLKGWVQRGGNAVFSVQDGCIAGSSVLDTPNSFLCTEKTYSDFILELEFKVDNDLNSGIQIRSNSFPEYQDGRVHGYQVEIDASSRNWTGGIYEEARRGWLHPMGNNEPVQKAFQYNQWNTFRIEAIGETIKVWLNGVPASYLQDDMTQEGFIALQVHGVGHRKESEGLKILWRNIRIITESPEKYSRPVELEKYDVNNKLTAQEIETGWKLLFDGKTSTGWHSARADQFPAKGWTIENGILTVLESGGGESEAGGDIVTADQYSDFELAVDFRMTPGANSGIKYYVDTKLNQGPGSSIGLEYQILDDILHPDAKLGSHEGSRTLASLYDLIKAENKFPRPMGQWNHARIISSNKKVEHWLNGRKVLEYVRGSQVFRKLVAESKYKNWPNFGELERGEILLQDHGNTVSFRNIKIREIR